MLQRQVPAKLALNASYHADNIVEICHSFRPTQYEELTRGPPTRNTVRRIAFLDTSLGAPAPAFREASAVRLDQHPRHTRLGSTPSRLKISCASCSACCDSRAELLLCIESSRSARASSYGIPVLAASCWLTLAQQVEPLGRGPRDEAQPAAAERGAREIWGDMGRYGEMQGARWSNP